MKRLLCIALLVILSKQLAAQELFYLHYNTSKGLAGSTIYDMCQDKDGFMWFATESGLSRYDGTHFKTFTVKDGLPDNEVLKVFADSKGRVWIGTFSTELCYYYNGKFYNRSNEPLLKKINFSSTISSVAEASDGTIAFSDYNNIMVLNTRNQLKTFSETGSFSSVTEWYSKGKNNIMVGYSNVKNTMKKSFVFDPVQNDILEMDFEAADPKFNWVVRDKKIIPSGLNDKGEVVKTIPYKEGMLGTYVYKNTILFVFTDDGAWSVDTVKNKYGVHYLPGEKISRVVIDKENNLWFSTLNNGVYKLSSQSIKNITPAISNKEVFSLAKHGEELIAGINNSSFLSISNDYKINYSDYRDRLKYTLNTNPRNRLYCSKELTSGSTLLGFDAHLVELKNNVPWFNYTIYSIKSIAEVDEKSIFLGTNYGALKIELHSLQVTDTIWKGRTTTVLYQAGNYYIGTLQGLYRVNNLNQTEFLGDIHPSLSRRVTDMKSTPDGTIWVATSDEGIIAFKNNKVLAVLNDDNKLNSNICKTLFLDGHYLWVGSNKGLNKIDISDPAYPTISYSISDGLPSDIINAIYVSGNMVYIGSPEGISFFDESKMATQSICNLKMLNASVAGKKISTDSSYNFPYNTRDFDFEYVAISLNSAGEINYYYKLDNLDDDWQTTRSTSISYPSLPPGKYTLQLYAINKFGVKSQTINLQFSIKTPYWLTWWFQAMVLCGVIGLTWWLVSYRNKKSRLRIEEKNNFEKQVAATEQQALQAQMNPHFIFNCLNSIQQYIISNNPEKANEYLTGFASLIRQTLESSSKKSITIEEEIAYITSYIEMEAMRFGDNFDYTIHADASVKNNNIEVPALLLQPYVENALRHGIRNKTSGTGKIEIGFSVKDNVLSCIIKDNGVGRQKAMELKSRLHIEYQSKGMSLTEKRVNLLNRVNESNISIAVHDLTDSNGTGIGTMVEIKIPLQS